MKSKKIVALIVAFAAFMAVATSGLAATTTTTYLGEKVAVRAEIDAETGKEVTYLVRNSAGDIIYIDQKPAASGKAVFDYKIAKDKIEDLVTSVQFGTNGTAFTDDALKGKDLAFGDVTVVSDAGVADVTFHTDPQCESDVVANTLGTEDEVYAKVEVADGFVLNSVTINASAQDLSGKYLVKKGDVLTIATAEQVVNPKVETDSTVVENYAPVDNKYADAEKYSVATYAIKVVAGAPTKVGLLVGDEATGSFYPALTYNNEPYNANDVYAVRIITDAGEVINGTVVCE